MCWLVRYTMRRTASWRRGAVSKLSCPYLGPLLLLGLFDDDRLVGVAHALALVGLRRLVRADLCGDLAHLLAVHAIAHDLRLRRRLRLGGLRERVDDPGGGGQRGV